LVKAKGREAEQALAGGVTDPEIVLQVKDDTGWQLEQIARESAENGKGRAFGIKDQDATTLGIGHKDVTSTADGNEGFVDD
jgi:hypothetical protein